MNWAANPRGGRVKEKPGIPVKPAVGVVTTSTETQDRDRVLDMLNDAFQALDEGLALFSSEQRFVMFNRKFQELMDTELVSIRIGDFAIDFARNLAGSGSYVLADGMSDDDWAQSIVEFLESYSKNIELQRTDGRVYLASSHQTGLGGYLVTIKDVTEQRRAEEAQHEADTLLKKIVDASPTTFLVSRVEDGRIIYAPAATRDRYGPTDSAQDFYVEPDDRKNFLDALLKTGSLDNYRSRFRRADGSIMQGLTSARLMDYKGEDVIITSTRDITEQLEMQAELENQREIAHQNEKLSALGELLAGVAHELNNPLSVVVGYSIMLQDRLDDPELKKRVERIGQSAEQCARIVKTFLAMARQKPAKLERCSLNELVRTAMDVAGYGLKANGAKVTMDLDPDLPPVTADGDQMAQVFTNLIANAEHAIAPMGEQGSLILRSFFDPKLNRVTVEISDNGHGIPKDIEARIFEPFFTTKDVGVGTGVGLAFCHRIVEAHGGRLSTKPTPGGGARFIVRLKQAEQTSESSAETVEAAATGGGRRVLVVDDEIDVTRMIRDMLEEHGYTVETENDPRLAVKRLETENFDAILSDIKMPGLNGEAFLNRIRAVSPVHSGRIAFVSGDVMSPQVADFLQKSAIPFLEKPVVPSELVALIEQLCVPRVRTPGHFKPTMK